MIYSCIVLHYHLIFQASDEFSRVQRERDELQKMLETFEKHLAKVYFNFQSLFFFIVIFLHFMIMC